MLSIALPHVNAWNAWYSDTNNRPDGVPALRTVVDEACRAVGRDPSEVERTVAVLVRLPSGSGRQNGDPKDNPDALEGTPEVIAEGLRAYAREGISHVQLVVDPITTGSLEALGRVLEILDRTGQTSSGAGG